MENHAKIYIQWISINRYLHNILFLMTIRAGVVWSMCLDWTAINFVFFVKNYVFLLILRLTLYIAGQIEQEAEAGRAE